MFGYLRELPFGPPDPTREWRRTVSPPLRFDVDRASLNDVGLGAPFDRLTPFGPRDRKAIDFHELAWGDLGVAASRNEEDRIIELCVHFVEVAWAPAYRPFPGILAYRGAPVDVARTTPDSFVELCGEPYWRDVEEDGETLLFYEFPGLEWQVEFRGEDGRLACLTVTSEPLMANAEQRKAYRVTKPWPPA